MTRVHKCDVQWGCDHLKGKHLDDTHYDVVVGGDEPVDVYKPNGEPLVKYRPGWFSQELCKSVLPACRKAAYNPTTNRGTAAGELLTIDGESQSYRKTKVDGSATKTFHSAPVKSGIVGYFDRTPRTPYCRQTSFLVAQAASWSKFLPYIKRADEGFREFLPERWAAQKGYAERTASDWVIPESTFTTVTVNRNFRTATHKDAGDLKDGFGVMSCIRNDKYDGACLVFPEFRVAVDFHDGCLCLADVHHWHTNTKFKNIRTGYERISLVFYYRENMINCKKAEEEIAAAKARKEGDSLK